MSSPELPLGPFDPNMLRNACMFQAAMQDLATDLGATPDDVQAVAAGILALAAPPPVDIDSADSDYLSEQAQPRVNFLRAGGGPSWGGSIVVSHSPSRRDVRVILQPRDDVPMIEAYVTAAAARKFADALIAAARRVDALTEVLAALTETTAELAALLQDGEPLEE